MSWQKSIVRASDKRAPLPPRQFIYSLPGTGKTTYAASLPRPILIDFDKGGADEVKVDIVPGPKTWDASVALIKQIIADPGEFQSLVIDTADGLEAMAPEYVSRVSGKSFHAMNDNYGAGHEAVGEAWKALLAELDVARQKGLYVCLTSHATVRKAIDPQLGSYDQFTSQLGKKPWALVQRWVDIVAFANFDAARNEDENRAIVTGSRVLYTVRGSGYEAKNRYAMPAKMEFSWKAVAKAIDEHHAGTSDIEGRILATCGDDVPLRAKVEGYIKLCDGDLGKLRELEKQLLAARGQASAPVASAAPARVPPLPVPVQQPPVQQAPAQVTAPAQLPATVVPVAPPPGAPAPTPANGNAGPVLLSPGQAEAFERAKFESISDRILAMAKAVPAGTFEYDVVTRAREFISRAKTSEQLLGIEKALGERIEQAKSQPQETAGPDIDGIEAGILALAASPAFPAYYLEQAKRKISLANRELMLLLSVRDWFRRKADLSVADRARYDLELVHDRIYETARANEPTYPGITKKVDEYIGAATTLEAALKLEQAIEARIGAKFAQANTASGGGGPA